LENYHTLGHLRLLGMCMSVAYLTGNSQEDFTCFSDQDLIDWYRNHRNDAYVDLYEPALQEKEAA
jgi:hypothetical protein